MNRAELWSNGYFNKESIEQRVCFPYYRLNLKMKFELTFSVSCIEATPSFTENSPTVRSGGRRTTSGTFFLSSVDGSTPESWVREKRKR